MQAAPKVAIDWDFPYTADLTIGEDWGHMEELANMTGVHEFRGRQILLTTNCMFSFHPHWHACDIEHDGPHSTRSKGKGWCLTTPAAYLWLIFGISRKRWGTSR